MLTLLVILSQSLDIDLVLGAARRGDCPYIDRASSRRGDQHAPGRHRVGIPGVDLIHDVRRAP
jgi:hypothetical protein